MEMTIERASVQDANEILDLQRLAYESEAEIYDDHSIPPLTQTLDHIQTDFDNQHFLKASIDGRISGSVRAYLERETCHIGRLVVHPGFQNRGIGSLLIKEIERCFGQAKQFRLFTGHRSKRNLRLYRSLGYAVIETKAITDSLTLVFMQKLNEVQ